MTELMRRRRALMGMQFVPARYVISLTSADLTYREALTYRYPYHSSLTSDWSHKRVVYWQFDLPLVGGHRYKFKAVCNYNTADMAVIAYNQSALTKVANRQALSANEDYIDYGWQTGHMEYELDIPTQINGSDVKGIRFSFRKDSSNSDISNDFIISSVTVEEVL